MVSKVKFHSTAIVSSESEIGEGTRLWQNCQVRENAVIGKNCNLGKDVYIDHDVKIGNCVKIQNGVSIFFGVTLEDGVFCGPNCVFTNDLYPRAISPDGKLKSDSDWVISKTLVTYGASLGANSTILCGITVGKWAVVGAGSVVTRSVPDYGLVYGNPARLNGFVCPCGAKLSSKKVSNNNDTVILACTKCTAEIEIPRDVYQLLQ